MLDGVQWLGTLDHRTCLVCGAFDGKIWPADKMHEIKVPPAHPNCRCVLIPCIDLGEEIAERPAEAVNFDQIAKEQYEAKYPKKSYDALSYEYRRALRYKAMKDYKGEPYKQMPGATFADYLAKQPESFQREWLGKGRFEIYKKDKLPLDMMISPDSGFRRTIKDLQEMIEKPMRGGWSSAFWHNMELIKNYNAVKETSISSEMAEAMRQNGFHNADDFANRVNEYVEQHDVLQRIELRNILQALADEPILKNQFETGTSSALLDHQKRIEFENVLSGRDTKAMPPRDRPIYGYVGNAQNAITYVEDYGTTVVVFKDSVRDRITFTIGNSSSEQGAFCTDVRAIFNKERKTKLHGGFMKLADDILQGDKRGRTSQWYLETQIWGGADLRIDVAEIAIGETDLTYLVDHLESVESWWKLHGQVSKVNVGIIHYVHWTHDNIDQNPVEWEKLKTNTEGLGIKLINTAK